MILNPFKGNSCSTGVSLMTCDVHQRLIVKYIYIKFHEILFGTYLVMTDFMNLNQVKGLQYLMCY